MMAAVSPARRPPLSLLAALVATLAAPGAWAVGGADDAQARITARKLGADAVKLFDTGYHAAALEKFDAAISLLPAPTLYLYSARCLVKLGRLVEASERYLLATRMQLEKKAPAVMVRAQTDAAAERDKLLPTIPQLKIEVTGPTGAGIQVLLDGREVPSAALGEKLPLDPGKHVVRAVRADATVERSISLAPGESTQLLLTMGPLPAPPPPPVPVSPPLRVVGWAALGVGAAGVVVFAVDGAIATVLATSLTNDPRCSDNVCAPALQGKVDSYQTTRTLTTVGLVVGVVGLAAGVPLVLLNPKKIPREAHVTPWIGAGSAGLRGTF